MTVKQAAEVLEVSVSMVYRLIDTGALGHLRIGKSIRVEQADIDEFKQFARVRPSPAGRPLKHIRPPGARLRVAR